jgi:hypothetical protein
MTVSKRTTVGASLVLLALLAGSAFVAWKVPLPSKLPAAAWNSSWVFRAEVFIGFFVGVYLLLAIIVTTITTGQPPKKLSFGLLAFEQQELNKTVEALSEGGTALQAVEKETRELEQRLDKGLVALRSAHKALIEVAGALPEGKGDDVARRAREQIEILAERPTGPDEPKREFVRAMTRFDQLLSELEHLRTGKNG